MMPVADINAETAFQSQMFAVVLDGGNSHRRSIPRRTPRPGNVIVKVRSIGLCRTDLAVIDGSLAVSQPLIPGHEFSGVISRTGEDVSDFCIGQPVAVDPLLPCYACSACQEGRSHKCPHLRMMGVDEDGACCEETEVPANRVYVIPSDLSFAAAAMAEPVAAVLAVADVRLSSGHAGVILGDNRIAVLTQRVLQAVTGVAPKVVCSTDVTSLPENSLDYVIESELTNQVLQSAIRLLKPGGTMIIKSRRKALVSVDFLAALRKEIIIRFAHYGCFRQAVQLLSEKRVFVDDLIGRHFPLSEFDRAIAWARNTETSKTFLTVGDS
jgi:threonine dehydrogenase-like Zn-dependent dehydrogenase